MIVDLDLHGLRLAVAEDQHRHGRAYVGHADHVYQLAVVVDGNVVEFQDYVAGQEFGGLGGRAGRYGAYLGAHQPRQPGLGGRFGPETGIQLHPDISPRHLAGFDELSGGEHEHVNGYGESASLAHAGIAGDGRVDADDFAAQIDQRSAAVARIDGGVGLQEILIFEIAFAVFGVAFAQFQIPPAFAADNAVRKRLVQAVYSISTVTKSLVPFVSP